MVKTLIKKQKKKPKKINLLLTRELINLISEKRKSQSNCIFEGG